MPTSALGLRVGDLVAGGLGGGIPGPGRRTVPGSLSGGEVCSILGVAQVCCRKTLHNISAALKFAETVLAAKAGPQAGTGHLSFVAR